MNIRMGIDVIVDEHTTCGHLSSSGVMSQPGIWTCLSPLRSHGKVDVIKDEDSEEDVQETWFMHSAFRELATDFLSVISDVCEQVAQAAKVEEITDSIEEVVKGAGEALETIALDTGMKKIDFTILVPLSVVLVSPPTPGILLRGYHFSTLGCYFMTSMAILMGAWKIAGRHPQEFDRTLHNRCAAALVVCGCQHLATALLGDHLAELLHLGSGRSPALTLHYTQDFVTSPLLAANLGYLTGQEMKSMLPTIAASMIGTMGALGSELFQTPEHKVLSLVMNIGGMAFASRQVSMIRQHAGGVVAMQNKLRAQLAGDLTIFCWSLYPLAQALRVGGVLPEYVQLNLFCMLDMLSKFGASHLMLRSAKAVRNAALHFGHRPPINEPQSEPSPSDL
mmetsp:Transcript_82275/g.233017  ORF Transcript_82275/g.233017 Transcript_82275/m.233017 type:complete len:393 (-) Transcript_82275:100-1278(-)